MSENGFMDLKKQMIKPVEHLGNENIITGVSAKDSKTFDKSVKYFNKRIASNEFEINLSNMVLVMIESLLCSKGKV